jgi:hypothetical protein
MPARIGRHSCRERSTDKDIERRGGLMPFENSVAVITGAGSGIGREIAIGLWREGSTVCLLDRDSERLGTFAGS